MAGVSLTATIPSSPPAGSGISQAAWDGLGMGAKESIMAGKVVVTPTSIISTTTGVITPTTLFPEASPTALANSGVITPQTANLINQIAQNAATLSPNALASYNAANASDVTAALAALPQPDTTPGAATAASIGAMPLWFKLLLLVVAALLVWRLL